MIEKLLETLGFTAEEARLYLALWQGGPATAGRIAQRHGLPRSSLYGVLDRLTQKGIVGWEEPGGVRRYHAVPPNVLKDIVQRRREELDGAQTDLLRLLPQLYRKTPHGLSPPRLKIYQGKAQLQNVLNDLLLYQDIETYTLWPIHLMVEAMGADYFRRHNIARIRNRVSIKAIWPPAKAIDIAKYPFLGDGPGFRREIRVAPAEFDVSMGYWIYENQVAVLSSLEECFGFVLESREFANLLRAQHMVLWKQSKPITTPAKAVAAFLEAHGDKSEMQKASRKNKKPD